MHVAIPFFNRAAQYWLDQPPSSLAWSLAALVVSLARSRHAGCASRTLSFSALLPRWPTRSPSPSRLVSTALELCRSPPHSLPCIRPPRTPASLCRPPSSACNVLSPPGPVHSSARPLVRSSSPGSCLRCFLCDVSVRIFSFFDSNSSLYAPVHTIPHNICTPPSQFDRTSAYVRSDSRHAAAGASVFHYRAPSSSRATSSATPLPLWNTPFPLSPQGVLKPIETRSLLVPTVGVPPIRSSVLPAREPATSHIRDRQPRTLGHSSPLPPRDYTHVRRTRRARLGQTCNACVRVRYCTFYHALSY